MKIINEENETKDHDIFNDSSADKRRRSEYSSAKQTPTHLYN